MLGRARDGGVGALVVCPPARLASRARAVDDIAVLAASLLEQQAESRYPFRDPLPVPVEEFLHTDDALGAWVADVDGQYRLATYAGSVRPTGSPVPTTSTRCAPQRTAVAQGT